jgi:phage tail sheath gpL-like
VPAPTAMSSSVKTPGFYLRVNLLAAAAAPGSSPVRALMIAHKLTTGDITPDTEVRTVYGPDDVAVALGEGSLGHLASIVAFRRYGLLQLDILAPTAPAGSTAILSLTIVSTPTTGTHTFEIDVAGRIVTVDWFVGELLATFRARVIATINSVKPRAWVASANAGAALFDISAAGPGTWGNDIKVRVRRIQGAEVTITGAGPLATGSGEFDITTALGSVNATEYFGIALLTSNADYAITTVSSNVARLKTHITTYNNGLDALLQYGFVAYTGSIANAKAGAIARNSEWMEHAFVQNARSLPAEVAGSELGDALQWYGIRANYNRIGNRHPDLIGSFDRTADKLTPTEREDLLNNGVSPLDFVAGGSELYLVDPITSHCIDTGGNPDFRCFYQAEAFGIMAISDDLRTFLPQQYPNASITPNLPEGADSLPEGVVEIRDVKSSTITRFRTWIPKGVLNAAHFETQVANGRVIVEIDASSEDQVNIFGPLKIVKPLAKFSGVIHKDG